MVMDNRQVVEQLAQYTIDRDLEGLARLLHPDVVVRYPQSGEVLRGRDNYLTMLSNYPEGLPEADLEEPHGAKQHVQVSSPIPFAVPTVTVIGSGDTFILEGEAGPYPDGMVYKLVTIVKLRDGKLAEQTAHFAAPFDSPDWRRPYVE